MPRRARLVTAGLVALIMSQGVMTGADSRLSSAHAPTVRPVPTVLPAPSMLPSPVATPTTTTPTPSSGLTSPKPRALDQAVATAEPTLLRIDAIGLQAQFGAPISPDSNGDITPPEGSIAALVKAYRWIASALPSSSAACTTYVYGHTNRQGPGVFNRLQQLAHRTGSIIELITPYGVLRYRIIWTDVVPKDELPFDGRVYHCAPGRLVLITCNLKSDGSVQTDNFVVSAQYVGAEQ